MSKRVFFSIIIPCFNRAELIRTTLKSILDQPFKNLEVIIVNDGSTDETKPVIASIQDTRVRYFEIPNSERGAARNYGLAIAEGVYVNYFDSDDLFLPCLEELHIFLKNTNYPSVVYGSIQHLDANGIYNVSKNFPQTSFTKNLLYNNFLACGSVFLKNEVAREFMFHADRRLSSAEDWELWLRVHTKYFFTNSSIPVFKQLEHVGRSLNQLDPLKIESRDAYFATVIGKSQDLFDFYGESPINLFLADRYTFIALAWSGQNWSKTFFYWLKAFTTSWSVVIRKRFWAVFFKLIFR